MLQQVLSNILLMIVPLIFALTVPEAISGFVANYYGDKTPKQYNRLSLNPIYHIDILGTIIIPLVTLSLSMLKFPIIFGWAKPIPINERNFKNQTKAILMVQVWKLLASLIMMIIWALLIIIPSIITAKFMYSEILEGFSAMCKLGVWINAFFFCISAIPVLPFPMGKIIDYFLPYNWSLQYQKVEPYSGWVVLILLMVGVLQFIFIPIASFLYNFSLNISNTLFNLLNII